MGMINEKPFLAETVGQTILRNPGTMVRLQHTGHGHFLILAVQEPTTKKWNSTNPMSLFLQPGQFKAYGCKYVSAEEFARGAKSISEPSCAQKGGAK